ncbi:MAG TPA: phosphatase PAP2 family protein [Thermoleophilaceae bacterium]|jgi:membrane-associated phospholipid phosphatase
MGSSLRCRRELLLDWLPLAVYLAASAVAFKVWGPPLRDDWTWAWVLGGLLVASIRQLRRWVRGVVVDWIPFVLALIAYDAVRGWSDRAFSITPHVWPQIDVDRFLFFGHIPTVVLQRAFYHPGHLHWWDYGAWGIYVTHFMVTVIVAAILWRLRPDRFRQFRTMVVLLSVAGVVTYALFPAEPPWMAGYHHYIPHVERVPLHAARHLGVHRIGALFERGVEASNLVAAFPSLHAAFPMLLLLFFWPSGRWVRLLLGTYAFLMALVLVYGGEHYVSDVLAGWAYAGGVVWVVRHGFRRVRVPRPALATEPDRE